uniref:Uncharacterized protein n=1 Tax=Salix viminalis TaxID=40686 RepID=A0A6N2KGP5_SALVM
MFIFAVFVVFSPAYFSCVSFPLVPSFSSIFLFSSALDSCVIDPISFCSSFLRFWSAASRKDFLSPFVLVILLLRL